MADKDPRKERLIELTKNANRTPVEETEREALAAEYPDFDASEDVKKEPSTESTSFKKGK